MNILILSNKVPYPPKDGGSIATLNLALGLAEFAKITLLTLNTSKHYSDISTIPAKISSKITFLDSFVDTKLSPISALKNLLFSKLPYNAERFIVKDFEEKIIQQLQQHSFDIIQLEGLYLVPYIPIIRKYSQAKISLRSHNVEHEIWQRTLAQETSFFKKKYIKILCSRIRRMETETLNQYDLLVPITRRDGKKLNKLGNHKPSHTTPTGYEIAKGKPKFEKVEFPSIFHLGALDWSPNQEGILWFINHCWPDIQKQMPSLKFYIAGRNAPKWLIDKMQGENIIYQGEVESATEFVQSKALMIVPLLSGSGMRIKVIEGMALGKTIVSTSIGVEGIAIEDKKNLLLANTPEEFSKVIVENLKDEETFFKMGVEAKEFIIQNFDNLNISKSLFEFYKQHI